MLINSFIPSGSGASIVHEALANNIDGYDLKKYSPSLEYFPFLLPNVCKSKGSVDIIHTTPDYGCFIPKKKSKLIVTFHNYINDSYMLKYSRLNQKIHYQTDLKFFIKKTLEKADCVTAVSRFTADLVKKDLGYKGDIKVIYNGIDTNLFTPSNNKKENEIIKVFYSGNLTTRKGAQWLAPIAERLNKNVIIYYTSGLRTKIKLPKSDNLKPIGRVAYQDMPKVYQSMDILLMPTVREGLSLSMLEAMACGLPVVGTKCSSLPELIINRENGFLVDVGRVEKISFFINMLSQSSEMRRYMSKKNRELVIKNFNLNLMVKNYLKLFSSC